MNRSLEVLKEIYKPYRYTIKGHSTILYSTEGNFVIKKKEDKVKELFSYLNSRNFNNYPELIDESRNEVDVYKYIEDVKMPKDQRAEDLIKTIANLHMKTVYYKEVSSDKFQSIYEDIKNNLLYLEEYYNNYFDEVFLEIYPSPSHYNFLRNYTKLISTINFCKNELDKWYEIVKDLKKERVCVVHNNLKLEHFLKDNKDYLISWNKAIIDTPVIDIVNLYHNEYYNLNFDNLLKKYLNIFPLNIEEEKLLFILLSMPWIVENNNNEIIATTNITKLFDYIYKTEDLIRPYYTENKKEQDTNFN